MCAPLTRVADSVARAYLRRCWWADLDDLRQEALLACTQAERTWDPKVGVPLTAYVRRAAVLAVRRWLWRQSAPVSASWHKLPELAGLHRAPMDQAPPSDPAAPWADEVLHDSRWQKAVRQRVEELLASGLRTGESLLALPVLLDGVAPSEVAREQGVPIAQVYRARRQATLLISQDLQSYRFWKELWE